MHKALMLNATMEVSLLLVLLVELFTPARSFLRLMLYTNILRAKYNCGDNTVFRIKYTMYDTKFYHQQVWNMLDEKLQPIVTRVPALQKPMDMAKMWFRGG